MDWVRHYPRTVPARWPILIVALFACGSDLGCARMNPFLRDDPPTLGTITKPTGAATATAPAASRGTTASQGPPDRPASSNDLYAQSFNRTQTRPAAASASATTAAESSPRVETASTSENGVRTTALDTTAEAANEQGVVLKPPVSLRAGRNTTSSPADSTPSSPPASETPVTGSPPEALRAPQTSAEALVADAQTRLEQLVSYQVAINRQERVAETLQDPEDVVLSIRRTPRAVRLQWKEGPHQGREVLYSEKETNGLLQVNMADSKIPVPRLSLPPNSPLALHNSRHPITEAGFDTILANLKKTIDENQKGDFTHGRITCAGLEQPAPLDHPCHKIVRVTANGDTWLIYLDPASKLPAMVQATAANGALLERYVFRNIQPDPAELLAADAFDPNQRWGESKGLLQRLAGATTARATSPVAAQ